MGLYVHQMAGFDAAKARQLLSIPEGYEPVAMMAVGYLGDPGSMPDLVRHHDRPLRARKPLDSLAFEGIWGEPWSPAADGDPTRRIQ
jgi:nitroreductase